MDRNVLTACDTFIRKYADQAYKIDLNCIKPSAENTYEHNMRICEICVHLTIAKIPFYTELRLKCGLRPDIVVPTHIKPIIEVLHSETEKDFMKRKFGKLPEELQNDFILVYTSNKFDPIEIY